jgi:uncharacterized damage-inducible protein DinB
MNADGCRLMAEYNRWMNERLYAATATLSEAHIQADRGAFFGSLFGTLNHIAVGDILWLNRFANHPEWVANQSYMVGFPLPQSLNQRLAATFPQLRELRQQLDQVIVNLVSHVSDTSLRMTLHYTTTAGKAQAKPVGLLLQHFFNHQTHHRGQASTLLFQAGVDIGVTDLNAIIPSET